MVWFVTLQLTYAHITNAILILIWKFILWNVYFFSLFSAKGNAVGNLGDKSDDKKNSTDLSDNGMFYLFYITLWRVFYNSGSPETIGSWCFCILVFHDFE